MRTCTKAPTRPSAPCPTDCRVPSIKRVSSYSLVYYYIYIYYSLKLGLKLIHFCGIISNRKLFAVLELETWSVGQLNELLSELEWRVQHHSETLIAELALRDELEYEKELKNTFISLLLNVQNKRRQMTANQKKPSTNATTPTGKNGNKMGSGFSQSDCKVSPTLLPLYHDS